MKDKYLFVGNQEDLTLHIFHLDTDAFKRLFDLDFSEQENGPGMGVVFTNIKDITSDFAGIFLKEIFGHFRLRFFDFDGRRRLFLFFLFNS